MVGQQHHGSEAIGIMRLNQLHLGTLQARILPHKVLTGKELDDFLRNNDLDGKRRNNKKEGKKAR